METTNSLESKLKEQWLKELSEFIVEANCNTYAINEGEVLPQRPGYKEFEYKKGPWLLRDSYTGYFRAPGMTTVYYKDIPSWTMAYGGHGQTEGYEDRANQTFQFLKSALTQVNVGSPFRGPERYQVDNKVYTFNMLTGDITDGLWKEEITESGIVMFTQIGIVGCVIHKDSNRQPIFPWTRS